MFENTIIYRNAFDKAMGIIFANLSAFAEVYPDDTTKNNIYPPRRADGAHAEGSNIGWTTGFWPGMLWLAYEITRETPFCDAGKIQAQRFAARIVQKNDVDHHDLGFLYTLSCVVPWHLADHKAARQAALMAADQLMTRYLDKPGIIQAWGDMSDPEQRGRTIVDSLMNMPLLYWASKTSGNGKYAQAAHRHACQLRDHFIRPDGSTFHTFYFNPETGEPRFGKTAQGAEDNSCWARGQAWALYGFTLNYAYTHDESLLKAACQIADVFISKLPADQVAYWDLVYGDGSGEERDSSASAIAVCGLLEIARLTTSADLRQRYQTVASDILVSLCQNYASEGLPSSNTLLLHGVYSKPAGNGVDEGNLWGDYFFLEALTRKLKPNWECYWLFRAGH